MPSEHVIFIAFQIVLILEFLHTNGIVHRDFKPENLLLTDKGRLKCIDFGTADVFLIPGVNDKLHEDFMKIQNKFNNKPKNSTLTKMHPSMDSRKSFVGTTYYIAPEMITDQDSVNPSVDLWAFGVILYRLLTGKYLFDEVNDYLTFEKIKSSEFVLDTSIDEDGKDLIKKLLCKVPSERIGFGPGGFEKLKAHPFFKEIDWENPESVESPLKGKRSCELIASGTGKPARNGEHRAQLGGLVRRTRHAPSHRKEAHFIWVGKKNEVLFSAQYAAADFV